MTVAVLSRDATKASFWEVYQVSTSVAQKRVPGGSWSMSASEDKLNQTNKENKEDISNDEHTIKPEIASDGSLQSSTEMKEKVVTFGKIIAVDGDPLMRRTDLTGLHLTCTTVVVSAD